MGNIPAGPMFSQPQNVDSSKWRGASTFSLSDCRVLEIRIPWIEEFERPSERYCRAALASLMLSLVEFDQVVPGIVQQISGTHFRVIQGRRRIEALKHLDRDIFRAIVINEMQPGGIAALQLPDNLHRDDPDPFDVADWTKQLIDSRSLTHRQAGMLLGRSRSNVTQVAGAGELPRSVRDLARRKARRLTMGFAIELAQIGDENSAITLLEQIPDKQATRSMLQTAKASRAQGAMRAAKRALASARRTADYVDSAVANFDESTRGTLNDVFMQLDRAHQSLRSIRAMLQRGHSEEGSDLNAAMPTYVAASEQGDQP